MQRGPPREAGAAPGARAGTRAKSRSVAPFLFLCFSLRVSPAAPLSTRAPGADTRPSTCPPALVSESHWEAERSPEQEPNFQEAPPAELWPLTHRLWRVSCPRRLPSVCSPASSRCPSRRLTWGGEDGRAGARRGGDLGTPGGATMGLFSLPGTVPHPPFHRWERWGLGIRDRYPPLPSGSRARTEAGPPACRGALRLGACPPPAPGASAGLAPFAHSSRPRGCCPNREGDLVQYRSGFALNVPSTRHCAGPSRNFWGNRDPGQPLWPLQYGGKGCTRAHEWF